MGQVAVWSGLANHHSSSQVDSAETAGRQNCTEPYRHRHSYKVTDTQRHRHTDRESCESKDTYSYTDRPRNRPKPHRDTHTETQFTIHHWFGRSVGHSHLNLSQTRLNVEIISDLLSHAKIRSDCVYLSPHSQREATPLKMAEWITNALKWNCLSKFIISAKVHSLKIVATWSANL